MTESETVNRAKEIFKEWLEKDVGEKARIMKAQCNPRVGSSKVYLQMKRTIYGSMQAARAFWIELQKAFKAMGYARSEADPCLYFKWDDKDELCSWLTWIDDCIVISTEDVVARESAKLMSLFECEDVGPLVEYIGNKVDVKNGKMKLTQPVLLQSFVDEFGVVEDKTCHLLAKQGTVLTKGEGKTILDQEWQTKYRSGVGKLRYLATWSWPDILNLVRKVSRHMQQPSREHWNGSNEFVFVVSGLSDSNFNQCPDTHKSVSGNVMVVNGVPVLTKSTMQDTMKLSMTEAELDSATTNVQDMLFVRQIIESTGFQVKMPMVLHVDNQGVRELVNNWSVGSRTRHVATKAMFLRELKGWGMLAIEYLLGNKMSADLLTKNLPGHVFDKHIEFFCDGRND
jgi:Reverse transcriptase (RNA-dependent DNA polymerase)